MTPKEYAALAARLAVGAVLVYAGASKAAGPAEEFAYVLSAYDVIPKDFTLLAAALMPWIELVVGWTLILGFQTRLAAAAAGALFLAFLGAVGSTVLRGIALPNCGCFGDSLRLTAVQTFAMDLCMVGLCWLCYNTAREQEAHPRHR